MFGRQPKENQPDETPDIMLTDESNLENYSQAKTESRQIKANNSPQSNADNPEVVNIVEKISGIVSPYFIVVVGLLLYEDNVWLGLLLIVVGIFSLLKISWSDIIGIFGEIKDVFGSDDSRN